MIAPRVDRPRLPDLEIGDIDSLVPRSILEAVSFDGVAFDGVDLTDAVFSESRLDTVSISDSVLRGIRFSEVEIAALNAPVLAAPLSEWRDVVIERSRVGSAELYEADLSMVRIENSKLGYLNLRGASLASVIISGCTIDELDLGGATARRVSIMGCELGTLTVTRATLADVDLRGSTLNSIVGISGLRGATIDETQLAELAPHLAAEAGILIA